MNILKTVRKPYVAILMASLILFVSSCSSEDINLESQNTSFDYNTFSSLKNNSLNTSFPQSISDIQSINDRSIAIINAINSNFKTQISLDQKILDLGGLTENEMESKALEMGIFSNIDIELLNKLRKDMKIYDFNAAILNLEKNVIELNLSNQEFERYNYFANILKLIHHSNPLILPSNQQSQQRGCLGAILAHSLATVSLSSCGTGVLCPVDIAAWLVSYANMIDACGDEDE